MKENERKGEKIKAAGKTGCTHQKFIHQPKKVPPYNMYKWLIQPPRQEKLPNYMNYQYYIEGKMGSKPKRDKIVKKIKRRRKVNNGVKDEQWRRRQFCNLRNFAGCENFAALLSASSLLLVSASLFFWFLTYSFEFDLNSSCLDPLHNFGINSLQNLRN